MGGATERDVCLALALFGALALTGCSDAREIRPDPEPPDPCAAVVNRDSARLYIIDDIADPFTPEMSPAAAQHWLSIFEQHRGIGAAAQGTLDDALAAFAPELEGSSRTRASRPFTPTSNVRATSSCNEASSRWPAIRAPRSGSA
jgi:hypothetical protein